MNDGCLRTRTPKRCLDGRRKTGSGRVGSLMIKDGRLESALIVPISDLVGGGKGRGTEDKTQLLLKGDARRHVPGLMEV